ncbi:MATE family efflux transporter [Candidatus Woesearchaeota archaeon CG_4_10_14_0_2_um_filter_33_13]|nr:MAG: MATE family efflux transporter [Candidatus Woesearchaeota archaeon CG_4_10_14_0_2_um_filter_33_13]
MSSETNQPILKQPILKKNHLLEGSIIKSILMIAIPVIFANLLQTVYQLIDTFWVGRLGTEAVAAVSLTFPLLFFLTSLAMGFAMAGSILVAQYNGRGDKHNVSLVTGQTLSLTIVLAIIISVLGYFSSEYLLSFLTSDSLVLSQATSYLQISFIAMTAMFIYNIFQSSLRGVGEVKFPTIIILITVIINFFIDPLFMYGWEFIPAMGVSGVALATLITESLAAIIGITVLIKGTYGVKVTFPDLKLRMSFVKKLLKLGTPTSLEMSSRSLGMVLMMFIVSAFGTLAIASYGIGTRMLMMVIIPAVGFSIVTSALVGNNLGARQHQRAELIIKTAMKIAFWTLTVVGVLMFIFAEAIATFFVPNETELVLMAAQFIHIMALTFGLIGIQMVIVGAVKAAGKTTVSMFLAMFHTVSLIVTSYLLSLGWGELGLWIAYPTANILALGLAVYFYKRKDWLHKELVD